MTYISITTFYNKKRIYYLFLKAKHNYIDLFGIKIGFWYQTWAKIKTFT